MREAVVVDAVRTPVARRGGKLAGVHPVDLSAVVLRELLRRSPLAASDVDDVVWGCFSQRDQQGFNIGRNAVLAAGWPDSVPALTVDRQCGSSQQAIHIAAAGIVAGHYDVAVAGGVESSSVVALCAPEDGDAYGPGYRARFERLPDQGVAAERLARRWNVPRVAMDEYALRSHRRAAAAQDAGAFDGELVPVPVPGGGSLTGDGTVRRGLTSQRLAALAPAFDRDGSVTAGNAAVLADGAAALLLTSRERALEAGLAPIARVRAVAVAATDPVEMLTAPVPATRAVLRRAGLDVTDIDLVEVNEAFAPVPLLWAAEFGVPDDLVNPLGGAIALGHPLGASGARIATTLLHHLRRSGGRYGLQVMCEGGGQANATVFELLRRSPRVSFRVPVVRGTAV